MNDVEATGRIAVIGAGPAGLAAAEIASSRGFGVDVFDAMPSVGRKFLMAGRGGLNLTHAEPFERFMSRYGAAAEVLRPAIEAFTPADLQDWTHGLGIETFIGSSGRVFPKAMKASGLLRAWMVRLAMQDVRLRLRHRWLGRDAEGVLRFEDGEGCAHAVRPLAAILALGGASWPRLGSDGAWVEICRDMGVPIAPLRPANCGFRVAWSETFKERHAGQPLKNIVLTVDGERAAGEAIVTQAGIEGGAIYAVGRRLRDMIERDGTALLSIDLKPDLSHAMLAERLGRPRQGASLTNFLRKATGLPPSAIGLLLEGGPIDANDRDALAARIKSVPLRLIATTGLARAISTAGGIAWDALDARYMLRDYPGLFVAGEMLDWEAPTGGYLLQACVATGRAAGAGAVSWLSA